MEAVTNLLRPNQREELINDKKSLEHSLREPGITDRGAAVKKIRQVEYQLETQSPKPYAETEIDTAVRREKSLKQKMLEGMPSQEEMRKSPPGAVGKHQAWETANKTRLLEWKHIQLRLNSESSDPDIANFERFRPTVNTLNLDNAVIPGSQYFMSPQTTQYQEGYERIFGHGEPLAELTDEQVEELQVKIDERAVRQASDKPNGKTKPRAKRMRRKSAKKE